MMQHKSKEIKSHVQKKSKKKEQNINTVITINKHITISSVYNPIKLIDSLFTKSMTDVAKYLRYI